MGGGDRKDHAKTILLVRKIFGNHIKNAKKSNLNICIFRGILRFDFPRFFGRENWFLRALSDSGMRRSPKPQKRSKINEKRRKRSKKRKKCLRAPARRREERKG